MRPKQTICTGCTDKKNIKSPPQERGRGFKIQTVQTSASNSDLYGRVLGQLPKVTLIVKGLPWRNTVNEMVVPTEYWLRAEVN